MKISRIEGTLHLPEKSKEHVHSLIVKSAEHKHITENVTLAPPTKLEQHTDQPLQAVQITAAGTTHLMIPARSPGVLTTNGLQRIKGVRENRPGHWQAYCRENGKWKHLWQGPSLGKAIDERLKWEAAQKSKEEL
jgi:hypothetical protein